MNLNINPKLSDSSLYCLFILPVIILQGWRFRKQVRMKPDFWFMALLLARNLRKRIKLTR